MQLQFYSSCLHAPEGVLEMETVVYQIVGS
uniref:Uncharacterized protein n=1 Tax=Arundo donax TaxID=35708 RepID=A0A0A9DPG5_ARUDO